MVNNKVLLSIFLCLLLLGMGIRSVDLWRPVDGRVRTAWRECDIAAVARNYYREGMNILYPRIDWRGNGPGFAEMEFPILSWLMAVGYHITGIQEIIGRLINYVLSLMTIVVFFFLSRRTLSGVGIVGAVHFFVLSPLAVRVSNSLQPEGLMFFAYILGAFAFIKWIEENKANYLWLSATATSIAVLSKATSAHIGLFYLMVIIDRKGWKYLFKPKMLIFAAVSLLPALSWYIHAHTFWLDYGNSLGVSNEYHWIGMDLLLSPAFLKGVAFLELKYVFMPAGVFVAMFGLYDGYRDRCIRYMLYWVIAIAIFYFLIARTSGDRWAFYYHIISIPPAAILFGRGIISITKNLSDKFSVYLLIFSTFPIGLILFNYIFQLFNPIGLKEILVTIFLSALTIFFALFATYRPKLSSLNIYHNIFSKQFISLLLSLLITATFIQLAFRTGKAFYPRRYQKLYSCANSFINRIPINSLILATGGSCVDKYGKQVAYNASYFFYWLDRKGYNICQQELSIERLNSYREKVDYLVLEKNSFRFNPNLENRLAQNFELIEECSEAYLFKFQQ